MKYLKLIMPIVCWVGTYFVWVYSYNSVNWESIAEGTWWFITDITAIAITIFTVMWGITETK